MAKQLKTVDYKVKDDEFKRIIVYYDEGDRTISATGNINLYGTKQRAIEELCAVLGITVEKPKKEDKK